MQNISIKQLNKEGLHYEYKKAKGGLPKTFWSTYSAFANTDGGYIFLGIEEDNGKYYPSGLMQEEIDDLKINMFNLANNKDKVNVNLLSDDNVEIITIDDILVLKVYVERCPSELRPVFINNNIYQGTFRRTNEGDYRCSIEEVNAFIRDASNKSLDLEIVENQEISSLDIESVNQYKNIFASLHPSHPFLKESNERFLEFIGAARLDKNSELKLTKAGLLMFGYSYRIVYEYSDFFLDYVEIDETKNNRWVDRVESTSGQWSGNIFSFFTIVVNKLIKDIKKPFETKGIYRDDDDEITQMIREALCNALCNADYYISGGVVIKKYPSYIRFNNPGTLMMDIDMMLRGGTSLPRNKTLLKMFNLINIGERAGSGVPLIYSVSRDKNLPKPVFEENYNPNRTTLTIFLEAIKNDDKMTPLEENIISFLQNNGISSAKEISSYLNKNITTIKTTLYKLVDLGIVHTSGTIKDKKYFL